MKTWIVIDDDVDNLKAVARGIRNQPACDADDEVLVLWAKAGGAKQDPFARMTKTITCAHIVVHLCTNRTEIVSKINEQANKHLLLLSDMNLEKIQCLDDYYSNTNELRTTIANLLSKKGDAVVCFYSSAAGASDVATEVGNGDRRICALGSKWLDGSRTTISLDDQVQELIAAAGEQWGRCHGNRLKMLWADPRTKDWFVNDECCVPHNASDIKDKAAYMKTICEVFSIPFPDGWFEGNCLNPFHEALKGMCGSFFWGRGVEPSQSVQPKYAYRLGSVVLIAALAFHEHHNELVLAPFTNFEWNTIRSGVAFSNSCDSSKVRLQGEALYEFFELIFKSDRHNGTLKAVEVAGNGNAVKLLLSWQTQNFRQKLAEELAPQVGELHKPGPQTMQGKWIPYCDGKPGAARAAFFKVLLAFAFEPGNIFGSDDAIYISASL